jgi:perosamine synthetase
MGPYEERFAALFGPEYQAFSFWKGRVALYALLKALDLGEKDEVILPGYTCVVVPNAIRFAGAKPVFADIASGQYNLDPLHAEQLVSRQTRALIVQHTYGIPANMGPLRVLAEKSKLHLIEDCAHVLVGSRYQGKLLGSFGRAAFFSSQWSKPYTTGLGGMVVTRDKELAKKLRTIQAMFRNPPVEKRLQLQIQYSLYHHLFRPNLYWFSQKSLNALSRFGLFVGSSNSTELTGEEPADIRWRMSDFQKRTGLAEVGKLQENSNHRRLIAKYYTSSLRQHGWSLDGHFDSESENVRLLRFPVQVTSKASLMAKSRRAHIEIGNWFNTPLHPIALSEHSMINYRLGCCPNAETTATKTINLPLHERVTQADAEKIVGFVLSHTAPAPIQPLSSKKRSAARSRFNAPSWSLDESYELSGARELGPAGDNFEKGFAAMHRKLLRASIIQVASEQVSCDLAGESVILSLKSGQYFGLNEVGARIWNLIQEPKTVGAVLDAVLEEYDVALDQLERDLFALLEEMANKELIEVEESA